MKTHLIFYYPPHTLTTLAVRCFLLLEHTSPSSLRPSSSPSTNKAHCSYIIFKSICTLRKVICPTSHHISFVLMAFMTL